MKLRIRSLAASIAAAAVLVATPASAIDVTVYNLNTTTVPAFGEPPYGMVTLSQNDSSVGVLVELSENINLRFAGDGSMSLFAFNATGVAASDIGNIGSKSERNLAVTQPGVDSPFGVFSFGIICLSNCTHTILDDFLGFTVADATLGDFRVESTGGNPNAQFAVNVFMTGSGTPGTIAGLLLATPVPEPQTYALLLAGLGAIGFLARRRPVAAVSSAHPGR